MAPLCGAGQFVAIVMSLVVSVPLSIYANITENPHLIVISSVAAVVTSGLVCILSAMMNTEETGLQNMGAADPV